MKLVAWENDEPVAVVAIFVASVVDSVELPGSHGSHERTAAAVVVGCCNRRCSPNGADSLAVVDECIAFAVVATVVDCWERVQPSGLESTVEFGPVVVVVAAAAVVVPFDRPERAFQASSAFVFASGHCCSPVPFVPSVSPSAVRPETLLAVVVVADSWVAIDSIVETFSAAQTVAPQFESTAFDGQWNPVALDAVPDVPFESDSVKKTTTKIITK